MKTLPKPMPPATGQHGKAAVDRAAVTEPAPLPALPALANSLVCSHKPALTKVSRQMCVSLDVDTKLISKDKGNTQQYQHIAQTTIKLPYAYSLPMRARDQRESVNG